MPSRGHTLSNRNAYRLAAAVIGLGLFASDRKSTRLNSSHMPKSRMPSSA